MKANLRRTRLNELPHNGHRGGYVSSRQFHIFTLALSTTDSDIDKSRDRNMHPNYAAFCRMPLGFDHDIGSASHFALPHLGA